MYGDSRRELQPGLHASGRRSPARLCKAADPRLVSIESLYTVSAARVHWLQYMHRVVVTNTAPLRGKCSHFFGFCESPVIVWCAVRCAGTSPGDSQNLVLHAAMSCHVKRSQL